MVKNFNFKIDKILQRGNDVSKEKITVAKAMVKCLQAEAVKQIFAYPGAAICPFLDEADNSDIETILVRHEANSGHAASGYARITGRPAVCVATSGPGATNLITAIATAYMDSIPVVAITGQVVCDQIGRDAFQEADITGAAEPFVKHSFLVKNAEDIAEVFKKAFYIAGSGRPGPVLIDVPMDVQNEVIEFSYPQSVEIRSYKPNIAGNKLQLKKAAAALEKSERPLICAGGGVFISNANELMLKLSESCEIPVISTMMGIGAIPTSHENYFGMLGMFGKKIANTALRKCDLLIILGARVGDRAVTTMKAFDNTTVIHIDIDPAEIGKNVPVNIPVVGDVGTILQQFLDVIKPQKHTEWLETLKKLCEEYESSADESKQDYVNPKVLVKEVSRQLPKNSVVAADVGQNQIWASNHISIDGGRFITSGGMGTMGYSLPAVIGAKAARPEAEVVAMCGDGSFQMQFMELATAVQHNINVKVIVFVNNYLGMVREVQDNKYGSRYAAVDLSGSPDFMKIAEAYGIKAENVRNNSEISSAVERMITSEKPYLLQVFVDPMEKTLID